MDSKKILNSEYLDILYAGRNKEYGGYLLRKKYNKRALFSAAIAAGIACLIILISLYEPAEEVIEEIPFDVGVTELINPPPPLDPEMPPPPPPSVNVPPPVKPQIKFTPPVVAPNELVREEDLPDQPKPEDNVAVGKITLEGSTSPHAIDPNLATTSGHGERGQATQPAVQEEVIHRVVEQMPEFPGGERALQRYLQNNIVYPQEARRNAIEGTVYVEFLVDTDGTVKNVKVVREPGGGTGREAMRVVSQMPKWKPGRQNNQNVKVLYSMPVNFTLR